MINASTSFSSVKSAIILAAGMGLRLGSKEPLCKALLPFAGRALIALQLQSLKECGVEKVIVISGYQHEELAFATRNSSLALTFIQNEHFAETNTLSSLCCAIDCVADDFFLLNGDVLLDSRALNKLLEPRVSDANLGCAFHPCGSEEMKVKAKGSRIIQVAKDLNPSEHCDEFLGVSLFRKSLLSDLKTALFDALQTQNGPSLYYEDGIKELFESYFFHRSDLTDLPIIEIDFQEDYDRAKAEIYPALRFSS